MNTADYAAMTNMANTMVTVISLISFAMSLLLLVSQWKLFSKAGVAGWKSLIPYYNVYLMCELSGLHIIWFILYFIPVINLIAAVWIVMDFFHSYDAPIWLCILGILFPIPVVPILAFSKRFVYIGVG